MKLVNLGTQIRQILIVTVLVGSISYAFNVCVARVLSTDDAARILTSWTFLNLCLLIIQFPIELYGPRLLHTMSEQERRDSFEPLVFLYAIATAFVTFGFVISYYVYRYSFRIEEVATLGILILASSWFQVFRTKNIAKENLRELVNSAGILCISSLLLLLLIFVFNIDSPTAPVWAVILGFTLGGLVNVRYSDVSIDKLFSICQERRSYKRLLSLSELAALSLSNLVSLLLVPGGAIFTGFVGLNAKSTVVYLASIALTSIPTTVLNSTSMPVYLRAINAVKEQNMLQFKSLFLKSVAVYFGISVFIVLAFGVLGERALLLFLGKNYEHPIGVLFVSAIASCIAFVTSLPRLFLLALGKTKQTYWPLILSVFVYLLTLAIIRNGYTALFASSIVGSIFIGVKTLRLLYKNIHALSEVAP